MLQTWGPLVITLCYTLVACILGFSAKGRLDMSKVENWSSSGNTMGLIVMVFLTGAGNVSAYTFLGAPGWAYSKGVAALYVVVYLGFITYSSYLISPRVNRVAGKYGYRTQAEGIGARFESKGLRMLCGIVGALAVLGNSLVQIIGSGHILNVMSNGTIPMWLGELIILCAIAFYVYNSGLRAIGWTNVMQGVLMLILSITVCLFVLYTVLGSFSVSESFRRLMEVSPEHMTLPGATGDFPPLFWTTSIIISVFSFWPQFWVWAAGGKDEDTVRKQYTYVSLFYLVMIPMLIVGFICVFAFEGYDGDTDKVALSFCMQNLPWWMVGLLGAGILAAAQSSAEPQLHTPAFTFTHDVIAPARNIPAEKEGKIQRKVFLVIVFLVAYPLALTNPAELVYILLVAYGFIGQLFPCMLGVFCWPRATKAGAIAGLVAGVIVVALCNFVWSNPCNIHAGIWGLMINFPVFIIVSLCTEPASEETLRKFFPAYIMDMLYEKK